MKLNSYIKESNRSDEEKYNNSIATIRSQCKPWLRAIKNCKSKELHRGYIPKDVVEIKNTRENREPKDTPRDIHTTIDVEFFKQFGWKVRTEGLFTYGHKVTGGYGTTDGLVFPMGKFDFVWSPGIRDFFFWYKANYKPPGTKESQEEFEYRKDWAKRTVDLYTNKHLCDALDSLMEIVIYCKKYIIIDRKFIFRMYKPKPKPGYDKYNQFIEEILLK